MISPLVPVVTPLEANCDKGDQMSKRLKKAIGHLAPVCLFLQRVTVNVIGRLIFEELKNNYWHHG